MNIDVKGSMGRKARRYRKNLLGIATLASIGASASALAFVNPDNFPEVGALHQPHAEHIDQADLLAVADPLTRFALAFAVGDELFETVFNSLDGVGADVGNGERFTRVPRADLAAWRNQTPPRATGPNAEACNHCHAFPFDDGAGPAALNVHRDPTHDGIGAFIQRNTPHLFGQGGLQRVAEEMTEILHTIRDNAARRACGTGRETTRNLRAKGVSFGAITAIPSGNPCEATFDASTVEGVNDDLVVRPFQWKGNFLTVREFNRDASLNELGMQPVEMTGTGVDGDGDGIVDEMTIGDQTAMAIYVSAQPRPTTTVELAELGIIPPLTNAELNRIRQGQRHFRRAGCANCHTMQMTIKDPVFSEPSQNPNYRDDVFPSGLDPEAAGVNPADPVVFNLTTDLPDNHITLPDGTVFNLGAFKANERGGAIVEAFSDLKLHEMGGGLAEAIDESGAGNSVWMTKELWGVGSTAPYMHDGRSTTITEAIIEHGGEAAASRDTFLQMGQGQQERIVDFLNSLVLFKQVVE